MRGGGEERCWFDGLEGGVLGYLYWGGGGFCLEEGSRNKSRIRNPRNKKRNNETGPNPTRICKRKGNRGAGSLAPWRGGASDGLGLLAGGWLGGLGLWPKALQFFFKSVSRAEKKQKRKSKQTPKLIK